MDNITSTPAIIESIDDRPSGVRILTLAPIQGFIHRAGQYLHVKIDGHDMRPYSIASAPMSHGRLSVHVRDMGAGLSHHINRHIAVGDTITIEGPFGTMSAEPALDRPVLMIAGGTGVAPMLALATDIVRRGLTEHGITLIFGARDEQDVYCRAELDALLATGEISAHMAHGDDTPDKVLKRLGMNLAHHIVYTSGPAPMMHAIHPVLLAHLAEPERILTDFDITRLPKE